MDQCVAVLRVHPGMSPSRSWLAHGAQQDNRARRAVEPDGVPDASVPVGYAENTTATRLSSDPMVTAAHPAPEARNAGAAARISNVEIRPSSSISLKESGTVMVRPSNSGTPT